MYIGYEAAIYSLAIRKDPALLNNLRTEKPYLFEHPDIKQVLVELFAENQIPQAKKPTNKPNISKNQLELYHWAWRHRRQGLTIDDACLEGH